MLTEADVVRKTQNLLKLHGLTGWNVTFSRATSRAGRCLPMTKTIEISRPVMKMRTVEDTMNTIRHEVAHAIVGSGHAHDQVWKRTFLALGGTGERAVSIDSLQNLSGYRWAYYCPSCHDLVAATVRLMKVENKRTRCCNQAPSAMDLRKV